LAKVHIAIIFEIGSHKTFENPQLKPTNPQFKPCRWLRQKSFQMHTAEFPSPPIFFFKTNLIYTVRKLSYQEFCEAHNKTNKEFRFQLSHSSVACFITMLENW